MVVIKGSYESFRVLHEFVMLMREGPYGKALSSTFAFA